MLAEPPQGRGHSVTAANFDRVHKPTSKLIETPDDVVLNVNTLGLDSYTRETNLSVM